MNIRGLKRCASILPGLLFGLFLLFASAAQAQVVDTEPNNSCTTAQSVGTATLPLFINGSLDTPPGVPDIDFYRFTATPGTLVRIDLQGQSTNQGTLGDPYLGVFGSACLHQLTVDDDGGEGRDSRLSIVVPEDGILVVAATSYPDYWMTGAGLVAGSYRMIVQQMATPASISGRVVNATTGNPVEGAYVVLTACAPEGCHNIYDAAYTDSTGAFRFQSVYFTAGDYQISVQAYNHETTQVGPFHLAEGQQLSLGDVLLRPIPLVGSIRGRAVDTFTGAPLSGESRPYAEVALLFCALEWYCQPIRFTRADAQGNFLFEGSTLDPLFTGAYQVRIYADQYHTTESGRFVVTEGQHYNVGDVGLKSFPVRINLVSTCSEIPSIGGDCRFNVRIANGKPERLGGEAWTIVRGGNTGSPAGQTVFEAGQKVISLAPGESVDLPFSFFVPGGTSDGAIVCVEAFVGQRPHSFDTLGKNDLFCLMKGMGSFGLVPEAEKRGTVRRLQGEGPRPRIQP